MEKIKLGEKKVVIEYQGCHHDELVTWYNQGTIIDNFIGGVEVTKEQLLEDVPSTFPNYEMRDYEIIEKVTEETYINEDMEEVTIEKTIKEKVFIEETVIDEETGLEIETFKMRPKKWFEYAGFVRIEDVPLTKTNTYCIALGQRTMPNRARTNAMGQVDSDEFYLWVNHFGIDNVKTKSEYSNMFKLTKEFIESMSDWNEVKDWIRNRNLDKLVDLRDDVDDLKTFIINHYEL